MAGSKTNDFENDLLLLYFNNTTHATVGDATGVVGSTAAGSLYVALHTTGPDDTITDQSEFEADYTGYSGDGRQAVARSGSGWTVSGNGVTNAAAITFGACTGGSNTITHFSVGTEVSGATAVLYWGDLTTPLAVSSGITPEFASGQLSITED